MILILAILAATRASPLGGLQSPPVVSLDQLESPGPSCDDPNGCRSLVDIIRSCIFTILLCTYTSIHPNIPSPDERWSRLALRRAGLMLLALFVPEAVIVWALRQRRAAGELAEEHQRERWTITHGFFAIMGGFMEYDGNQPVRVLLPEQLESYSLTGNGNFPRISEAEIEDKSKGDAITKSVVILQTGWFVMQCIARGARGLPITELELVTVAFAALNFVIYLLWWNKPQNVRRGVRVNKKRITEMPWDDGHVEANVGSLVVLPDLPGAIVRGRSLTFFRVNVMISHDSHEDGKRVGTFYPNDWGTASYPSFFLVIVVALAFGGIHCIGWSFDFPSSIERIVWRVAALYITCAPLLFILLVFAGEVDKEPFNDSRLSTATLLLLSFYLLSRLALLVLPLISLRSLPPAAFHVVHWTTMIPHV